MTTYVITPKQPHPITGLQTPVLGWHFTGDFADIQEGMVAVRRGGWLPILEADAADDTGDMWLLRITRGGAQPLLIKQGCWLIFDGYHVRALDHDDLEANYVTTASPQGKMGRSGMPRKSR